MRSIITSLLFIIMLIILTVQFILIFFRLESNKFIDIIDKNKLLTNIIETKKIDETEKIILIDYLGQHLNFIFYSKSYPSIVDIDFSTVDDSKIPLLNSSIFEIKEKLNIEYSNVLKIRRLNNIIYNNAIFLLVNISILLIYLFTSIVKNSFATALKLLSTASIITGAFMLLVGIYFYTNYIRLCNEIINIIKSILNNTFITNYINLALTYIFTNCIILLTIYYVNKTFFKNNKLYKKI